MNHFPTNQTRIAASVAHLRWHWHATKAATAPAASTALVDRIQQDIDEAVSFQFETEPVAAAEWLEIYSTGAALAARRELVLPAAVLFFEFVVPSPEGPLTCACIGRQLGQDWQSYLFVEAKIWRFLPIHMLHFPERMISASMPSVLIWLESGRSAWPDADAFLACHDAGQRPSPGQFVAHLAVQAGELLLYLAVAARQHNQGWCVVRCPPKLHA